MLIERPMKRSGIREEAIGWALKHNNESAGTSGTFLRIENLMCCDLIKFMSYRFCQSSSSTTYESCMITAASRRVALSPGRNVLSV